MLFLQVKEPLKQKATSAQAKTAVGFVDNRYRSASLDEEQNLGRKQQLDSSAGGEHSVDE